MDRSDLRHACAVMGLSPPITQDGLKHRYKELVKRWHPDRYQSDPIGQAEAAQRLREINSAHDMISRALEVLDTALEEPLWHASAHSAAYKPDPATAPPRPYPLETERSSDWSEERIDAIVNSINQMNKVRLLPVSLDWHRIASGIISLIWLAMFTVAGGVGGFLMGAVILSLPVMCIWFPETMGDWVKGRSTLVRQSSTPEAMVRLGGWLLLLAFALCLMVLAAIVG